MLELDRRAHEQHAPVAEGVTLATLHAAKGLEWDAVFLCGVQEGSMPIVYAHDAGRGRGGAPAALRRGDAGAQAPLTSPGRWRATRASRRGASRPGSCSTCCLAVRRRPTERAEGRPAGQEPLARRKATVCRVCQSSLASSKERNRGYCDDCPVPYDEELFGSLSAWRKERADAESVPAYVVFSDATLEALAEVRPTDRQALLRINGIGAAKLEKYADDVLEILA